MILEHTSSIMDITYAISGYPPLSDMNLAQLMPVGLQLSTLPMRTSSRVAGTPRTWWQTPPSAVALLRPSFAHHQRIGSCRFLHCVTALPVSRIPRAQRQSPRCPFFGKFLIARPSILRGRSPNWMPAWPSPLGWCTPSDIRSPAARVARRSPHTAQTITARPQMDTQVRLYGGMAAREWFLRPPSPSGRPRERGAPARKWYVLGK